MGGSVTPAHGGTMTTFVCVLIGWQAGLATLLWLAGLDPEDFR